MTNAMDLRLRWGPCNVLDGIVLRPDWDGEPDYQCNGKAKSGARCKRITHLYEGFCATHCPLGREVDL